MKSLLFYQERKFRREKRIKSKKYIGLTQFGDGRVYWMCLLSVSFWCVYWACLLMCRFHKIRRKRKEKELQSKEGLNEEDVDKVLQTRAKVAICWLLI